MSAHHTPEEIRKNLKHPVIDGDGHWVEYTPVFAERMRKVVGDLGAESIDFLDIVFKLEKAFGIEIPRKELSPEDILTNADFVQEGKVTPAGITELKQRMPFVDFAKFEANPQVREFSNLLTVGDLCRYVELKVGA